MEKNDLKNNTMNERELQRVYNHNIYPRDSKIITDKGFVEMDNGPQGGTHWTCYIVKITKLIIFIVSKVSLINFCTINYLNR